MGLKANVKTRLFGKMHEPVYRTLTVFIKMLVK